MHGERIKSRSSDLEDILARRTRLLFLDAKVASGLALTVASLLAQELQKGDAWRENQITEFRSGRYFSEKNKATFSRCKSCEWSCANCGKFVGAGVTKRRCMERESNHGVQIWKIF